MNLKNARITGVWGGVGSNTPLHWFQVSTHLLILVSIEAFQHQVGLVGGQVINCPLIIPYSWGT